MDHPEADKRHPTAELGASTWTELERRAPGILVFPLGSCEQHGPHLPFDTDARIATAVAHAAAARRHDIVVAPTLAYGASGEHQTFPGTLSVGTEALRQLLVELGRSALPAPGDERPSPFRALVVVNGHGGNLDAVESAVDVLAAEGRPVRAWWPRPEGGDAHAGRTETSLLLALSPGVVRPARPVGATEPVSELWPRMRRAGVRAVSDNGVLGDARRASATEGRRLLTDLTSDLVRLIDDVAAGGGPPPGSV